MRKLIVILALAGLALGVAVARRLPEGAGDRARRPRGPAPVEVAAVEAGTLELRRTFSGTVEATARYAAAPRVGGRVVRLAVDVGDPVGRGQLVAELDDAEFQQAVARADADLAVARANLAQAQSSAVIARRALERATRMHERGVSPASQLDVARDEQLAKDAAVEVAQARVVRAEAEVETARIRLGYTRVLATWNGGAEERVVAERFVDEGDTVAANASLLSIVEQDPVEAVVFVTERDYGNLEVGQPAALETDAFPGRSFPAAVARVAPVFRTASRQARVELTAPNPRHELKPGMFVRATVVLARTASASIVPQGALTRRDGRLGVFVVDAAGDRVTWRVVVPGIQQGDRVAVTGEGVRGRVVTLGQQLLDDGAAITIPAPAPPSGAAAAP